MIGDLAAPSDAPACLITDTPDGLAVIINDTQIPLRPSHAERTIHDILLFKRASIPAPRIASHLEAHQSAPDPKCGCCILSGRVLSAQGRSASKAADLQIAAARARASSGTVQVRRFRPGLSGAQLSSMLKRGATPSEINRAADKARPSSTPTQIQPAWDMI